MWKLFGKGKTDRRILIVGLGNIGSQYDMTRHNAGFAALASLKEKSGISLSRKRFDALVGEGTIGSERVLLAEPQTYMNNSGIAISQLAKFYKIPASDILVLVDDIDLPLGQLRMRAKGGPGTHNGMRSIVDHLGSGDFPRIRIGVGKPPAGWDLADFVLAKLRGDDAETFLSAAERAAQAAELFVREGAESAMRCCNKK